MDLSALFSSVPWHTIMACSAILMLVLGGWVFFLNKFNPTLGTIDEPDAVAIARGNCGDSMKISLISSKVVK